MIVVAALIALAVVVGRTPRGFPHRHRVPQSSVSQFARLLSIAAAAGLPLGSAIERVAPELDGELGEAMRGVARSARTIGLASALLGVEALGSLAPALARAHVSGSPLSATLDAFLAADASKRVTAALEMARTAPVKLMVPLALLLLPGFTALVVGPTLLDHLLEMTRLGT